MTAVETLTQAQLILRATGDQAALEAVRRIQFFIDNPQFLPKEA